MVKRIESIDIVRGLAMIIMALDHTRDFLHVGSLGQNPLLSPDPALFFTRWITHLCAPAFVFLSGVSAFLTLKRSNSISEMRKHLLIRGFLLIIIDFTIVNFGIWFDVHFNIFLWNVLSAIGFGFIILAFLLRINPKITGIIGLLIIFLHNALPLILPEHIQKTFGFLFSSAVFPFRGTMLIIGYPPIPWLGIVLAGFGTGNLFLKEAAARKKIFLYTGISAVLLFLVLRGLNVYGDPNLWNDQKSGMLSFLSFMNVTKYPPSLLFCLITLGIMFIVFYLVEGIQNRFTKVVSVYGKVPLFYFLLHWYIIHPVLFLILLIQGFSFSEFSFVDRFGRPQNVENGVSLFWVYFFWMLLVIVMYPLCQWYFRYKSTHKEKKWLRYL